VGPYSELRPGGALIALKIFARICSKAKSVKAPFFHNRLI